MKKRTFLFCIILICIYNVSCSQKSNPDKSTAGITSSSKVYINEKFFLSSERDWVTIISYSEWNEDKIENYAGSTNTFIL